MPSVGPGTGRTTARCGRSRPVTRDRVPSSAIASCASAVTAPGKCPYWTHVGKRGRGYARNALALLVGYAASIGVTRLEAHVAPDNHASRHVAEAPASPRRTPSQTTEEPNLSASHAMPPVTGQPLSRNRGQDPRSPWPRTRPRVLGYAVRVQYQPGAWSARCVADWAWPQAAVSRPAVTDNFIRK